MTFPEFEHLFMCTSVYVWLRCDTNQLQYQPKAKSLPVSVPPFTEDSDMSLFYVFTAELFAALPFGGKHALTHTHACTRSHAHTSYAEFICTHTL